MLLKQTYVLKIKIWIWLLQAFDKEINTSTTSIIISEACHLAEYYLYIKSECRETSQTPLPILLQFRYLIFVHYENRKFKCKQSYKTKMKYDLLKCLANYITSYNW